MNWKLLGMIQAHHKVPVTSTVSFFVFISSSSSSSLSPLLLDPTLPATLSDIQFLERVWLSLCVSPLPGIPFLLFYLINLHRAGHPKNHLFSKSFHWHRHTHIYTHQVPFTSLWYHKTIPPLSHNTVYHAIMCAVQIPTSELWHWVSAKCLREIFLSQMNFFFCPGQLESHD